MIFGIGLSKTGTTSLGVALKLLGIKTKHYIHSTGTLKRLHLGRFVLPELAGCGALAGNPAPIFYPQFDEAYPGSRFILTVRDLAGWLQSCRAHFGSVTRLNKHRISPLGKFDGPKFYRTAQYGCVRFHSSRWAWAYRRHLKTVEDYFSDRPKDLLVFDVKQGWKPLCAFLGRPVPSTSFPHTNKR